MERTDAIGTIPARIRLLLAVVSIVTFSVGVSIPARGEPISCLPGQKGCGEVVVEKKVQTSFDRAVNVFVGQLESIQDSKSGTSATHIFTFKLERQFKGTLSGKVVRVSIDSYLVGGTKPGQSPQKSLGEFEQLEVAAESADTEEAKEQYLKRVASLREAIKKYGADESVPTYVVRLDLTDGDRFIRSTDVPMRVGERYAVFVLVKEAFAPDPKKDTSKFGNVLINPVDLYPTSGDRGKRALAALELASKQKRK